MAGMRKNSEKGAVLIIVLFIIAGLAVVSVDMNRNVLLEQAFALTSEAGMSSKAILKSGEAIAANFFVRDYQREKEKEGQESMASVSKRLDEWVKLYAANLKKWDIEISFEDENSRFPLKALFPTFSGDNSKADFYAAMLEKILAFLLIRHGYDGGEEAARLEGRRYVENLLAWGGRKMLTDAAARWYLTREPAYYPPLRAPECLSELLLVYWPDMDEKLAGKVLRGDGDIPGLLDNCSIWTQGPLNLNTMKPVVGWGFCGTLSQAEAFMEDMEKTRQSQGDWLKPGWHGEVFAAFGIQQPPSTIAVEQSRWFRVRVKASRGLARNFSETVGWINKTRMTWVSRSVL